MPRSSRPSESAEGVCPVCSETINIFAVGMCDHPVCYICLTRMRVLCEQLQCVICRVELPKVIFLKNSVKYAEIDTSNFQVFRKHKIYFENQSIQDAFYQLLDHACQICDQKKFRTFSMLRDHMRRDHQLNYCELCVSHLKVFSHERKCYDRTRLGLHRRVGDADDKGHKGHPLCEFCDERFLDNDELVRHLRKEHYFCHFCDADGITNQFYSEYSFLREHFKEGHYLCEEGECHFVEFTNAFRSDIDLKGHIATDHINRMKKSQARQARTLDIGFNLTPREGGGRRDRDWDRDRDRDRDRGNRDRDRDRGNRDPDRNRNQERDRDQGRPSRGRHNGGSVVTGDDYEEVNRESQGRGGRGRGRGRGRGGYSRDQREAEKETEETARAVSASMAETPSVPQNKDFPSLDGKIVDNAESKPEAVRHDPAQSTPDNMATYVARNSNFSIRDGGMGVEDFPSLGGPKRASNSDGNSAWAFKPTNKDFPALGQPQKPKARPASTTWQSKPAAAPAPAAYQVTAPFKRPQTVPTASRPPPSLSSIGSVLLSSSKSSGSVANNTVRQSSSSYNSNSFNVSEVEDFPSLGGSKPPQLQTGAYTVSKSSSKKGAVQVKPTVNAKTVTAMFDEEFPTLGGKKQPSQQLSMPAPTISKQNAPKPDDVESIAMKKLQNQQKRLERDAYKLPEKEPEQEWTVKPVSEKAKKQEQEKVKKLAAKSQASPEVSRREEGSSKGSKSQGPKSSQQKKPMDDKAKKPSADSSDKWQTSQDIKKKKKAEKLDDDFPSLGGKTQTEKLSSDQWQVSQTEKTQEKKKKKVEKFEDDFPSLDGKPVEGSSFDPFEDQWQTPQVEKKQEKKKTKKVEKFEDDFPSLDGKPVKGSSFDPFDDQWQTPQVEKKQEKKKNKKVENFEDDFPTLGGKPTDETTVKLDWGQKEKKDSTESIDEMTKLKSKKKNKKEKNEANKEKVESEPEPTWGYVPDFVAPVVPKERRKAPPGIVYKENKENKRDKKQPWGDTTPIDETGAPSLFKLPNEDLYGGIAGALKDQSNLTLASLTANLKGFSLAPETPVTIKDESQIDDFPSLGGGPLPTPPPGLGFSVPQAKPPPGFSAPGGINDAPVIAAQPPVAKPPPGFSAPTATPVATDIPATVADPPAPSDLPIEYQKPNHFMDRNISLISAVQSHLGDSEEKFMQFKKSSGQFRQGRMSGSEYYAQCNNIIGPDGFREIFSELLVLLPDIDKQHELLAAYNEARQPQRGMTTKKEKAQRKAWATLDSIFTTCPACRQVLVDRDVADHGTEHHMDNDFPTLGATPGNKYGFSAWVKGN